MVRECCLVLFSIHPLCIYTKKRKPLWYRFFPERTKQWYFVPRKRVTVTCSSRIKMVAITIDREGVIYHSMISCQWEFNGIHPETKVEAICVRENIQPSVGWYRLAGVRRAWSRIRCLIFFISTSKQLKCQVKSLNFNSKLLIYLKRINLLNPAAHAIESEPDSKLNLSGFTDEAREVKGCLHPRKPPIDRRHRSMMKSMKTRMNATD